MTENKDLQDELAGIQFQYEYDMQMIADQIEKVEEIRYARLELAYKKAGILLPEKHKPPDMS